MLKAWSENFKAFPLEALNHSIIARFREQVAVHGDRPAVISGARTQTYAELDRLANRVANLLLTACGKDPDPVAFLMDQGPLTVVAILGALKAGKIYLPLDPRETLEQLAGKLDDAGAPLILADQANEPLVRPLANPWRRVIELSQALKRSSETDPDLDLRPERPVYMYYTSGSTGPSKGVFDNHRNVLHNILRYTNTLQISSEDRLSLIQAPCFSGTVSSLFGALLNGATVYPLDLRTDGIGALSRCIREQGLTMFHAVPSIFERLLRTGDRFPSLRVIRLEGDQTFKRHVDLFQSHFSAPCVLVNGLGATETGLTRQFFIDQTTQITGSVVPIGFATSDMEALIWSPEGQVLPTGEVGEIIIRSRYLAKGYWRKPDLTDQAFAPCGSDHDLRTYRTGDLGRLRTDGCLEYLGRKDSRIKVHGQWVDLEAIQEAITAIPTVTEALVHSRADEAHGPGIVAYVVPARSAQLGAADLRRVLINRLPADMIPSAFVILDALPLDANGKVDRKALPAPDLGALAVTVPRTQPRNETESLLARCWCQALDVTEVGINDDFFARGGDSLRALELVLRIERSFGESLPLSIVIEAPTVATMTRVLQERRSIPVVLPLQSLGSKRPFFCVHGHDGEVLQLRPLAQALGPNRPVYGLRLPRGGGGDGWVTTVEAMARLYVGALRARQSEGPYLLGGYCFGGLVAFEMARLLAEEGQSVACLALIVADAPGHSTTSTPGSWLSRRLRSFRALPRRERSRYVTRGCLNVSRAVTRRVRMRLGGYLWALYEAWGRRPPAILRNPTLICDIAVDRYVPHPYAGSRAAVFGCPPEVSNSAGPYAGWQDLVTAGVNVRVVDATTSDVMKPPGVELLGRELEALLEQCEARPEPSTRQSRTSKWETGSAGDSGASGRSLSTEV